MTSFHNLGLCEPILRALAEERYATPTPIQLQTIPVALSCRDVIGIAQTGTGKTAAFALPILHHLAADRRPPSRKACRVLVLSPTRELARQILDSFKAYGRHLKISGALVIGGVPMGAQIRALLDGVEVLVATPGRLLDLVRGNALRLGEIDFFVLDEADRMLDMGFIHDIRKIVAKLPSHRQTMLFSATMPGAIAELAGQMLREPVKVAVTPVASTVDLIEHRVIHLEAAAKHSMLTQLLRGESTERVLVFTRTKHRADLVVRRLMADGITAEAIHGNKSQNNRDRTLAGFRDGRVQTLVATDIAARGIDVEGISHVVNFDLPHVPETYVHRIGRTGALEHRELRFRCARPTRLCCCAGSRRSSLGPFRRPGSDRRRRPSGRHNIRTGVDRVMPLTSPRAKGFPRNDAISKRRVQETLRGLRGSRSCTAAVGPV